MTYKELLFDLALRTGNSYNSYLDAKIASVINPVDFSAERTEQHRAENERLEKKLIALLAKVKNEVSADANAPGESVEEFLNE